MKKKKKNDSKTLYMKHGRVFLILIFLSVLFLSVGYAAVSGVHLGITGSATTNIHEILITDVSYYSDVDADLANSSINNYYHTILDSTVALANDKDSQITYSVTITNFDSGFKKYKETLFDTSCCYDNTDITFEYDGLDTNTVLAHGESVTFKITFKYNEEKESYDNTVLNSILNIKFEDVNYVAKIGNTYYEKIQTAINTATTSDLVTVDIVADTNESSAINAPQNIKVNLNGHTIHNVGNSPVFNIWKGHLEINGPGTLIMDDKQAAANNNNVDNYGSRMILNNVTIRAVGLRQAVYNKGYCEINGGDYHTVSTERPALQNESGATMKFTSGKAYAPNWYGITNSGNLEIGSADGSLSQSNPEVIGGYKYGIAGNGNVYFYDGIVKSVQTIFQNANKVTIMEEGYSFIRGSDTIEGRDYITNYLGIPYTISFNYNGGTNVSGESSRIVESGHALGALPATARSGYVLVGWYTAKTDGTEVTADTIIDSTMTIYAVWTEAPVATYNGNEYYSIQAAINDIPTDGSESVITITENTTENIKVFANQNVVLELDGHTFSNKDTNCVIENYGTVTVRNGTLTSNSDRKATINNMNGGVVNLVGGSITNNRSVRQAVYNPAGGIVNISGTAYLYSKASGDAASPATIKRGTVQNEAGGIINITGGTIECSVQYAVANEGELNIGTKDGNINITSPDIRAEMHAILNKAGATLNIYDGAFAGKQGIINGTYTELEPSTHLTDVMDGDYHTSHLESD